MSKLLRICAGLALLAGAMAFTPVTAQAQHWHHGWHHNGWGPGFGLGFGLGLGAAYPYGPYYGPPYYAAEPACGWTRVHVGYHRWRRVWQCW